MKSEIQHRADFNKVRYANCWEDADILVKALEPQGRDCLCIGSAGDNSFSLLAAGASSVTIAEMNPAQIACIQLRIAAYKELNHSEFLTLLGETGNPHERVALYERCKPMLPDTAQEYWQHYSQHISAGFGRIGKFENYFKLFREKVLPLVHGEKKVKDLLTSRSHSERSQFYYNTWNTWRWRLLFKCFFSRFTMGKLGRDPEFFKYVEGSVADRILSRTMHALIELEPNSNPYLNWILLGRYGNALPMALRAENFDTISKNIERVTILEKPLEAVLHESNDKYDAYNLSDIFEYMSLENTEMLLKQIVEKSNPGARLAYWNMLAPRSRPEALANSITSLTDLSNDLHLKDKAFFYSKFIVEEVTT